MWPLGISIVSLLISIGSFVYTMRTFAVTQRPYVGMIGVVWVTEQAGTPAWRIVFKNSGARPARVQTVKNQTTLTTDGVRKIIPTSGSPASHTVLMPGVESQIFGSAGDGVNVNDLLSGRTKLEVEVEFSYEATGDLLWSSKYHYKTKQLFEPTIRPMGFITTSGDAN